VQPGESSSCAFGINSSAQVVGVSYTSGDNGHAFLYSNGSMIDLNGFFCVHVNRENDRR